MDFGAIYKRQLKGPYTTATPSAAPQHHNVDISLEEWMRIFMAFQVEHVRSFPRDVTDIVLYLVCQPPRAVAKVGGNKLARSSLGLPTSQYQPQQPQLTQQAQPSQQQPPSQGGILMQSGMCWRFQSARVCDGSCLWLRTHQCYTCGGDHRTKVCPSGSADPDWAIPEQQQQ